jgi:PAS domain S-box-containing protein
MMPLAISPAAFNSVRWKRIARTLRRPTICIVTVTAVTAILYEVPIADRSLAASLTFLFIVLVVSRVWGFRYAVFVSLLTALGYSWLLPPVGRFWLDDPRDVFTMVAFLVIGIVTSHLSERARRSEKELRDVVETMPAMAWTALPDGFNTFHNKRWTEYTGLSAEDSAGRGWEAAAHPEDLDRHVERWLASLDSGQPFESEVRLRSAADGEYRWFLARAVPLLDERGKILKWHGMVTDIEDRKRAEQERESLRRLEADLAHMSRVIGMGELAASLAHEIKQPMAAAVTNAGACARWLRRGSPDVAEASNAAARMVTDVTRAADIIDRVRALYRRDSPQRQRVDLNEIIREMVVLLQDTARRNSVSVHTGLDPGLPAATVDRVQLQQVVMNLMLNGIEAMTDTGGQLTVASNRTEDGHLQVSVTDLGVGLPADQTELVFEPFFTTKPQGTGLGLSISRRIIESHGGRLWASAHSGRGATFQFRLPE